ncbi:unnamed protein product [Malus baccata var. baccata]
MQLMGFVSTRLVLYSYLALQENCHSGLKLTKVDHHSMTPTTTLAALELRSAS